MKTNNEFMNKRYNTIVNIILFAFIACVLFLNIVSLGHFLNSDMYGDFWVAKLMWEQKTLFPSGYVFGNQIYILSTPNFAALIYGITDNMLLSGSIASFIMFLLFLQSFYWFLLGITDKQNIKTAFIVFFSLFIAGILPNNLFAQLFLTGATFYSCYAITLLLVLGTYVRLLKRQSVSVWFIVISIILSFAMGIQSARQTCIQVIPMCIYEIGQYCFYRFKRKEYPKKVGLFVVIIAFFNLLGLLVSHSLTISREAIYGNLSFSLFDNIKGKIVSTANCFKGLLGLDKVYYSIAHGSFSLALLPQVFLSVCLTIFIIVAIVVLTKKKNIFVRTSAFPPIAILTLSFIGVLATFWVLDIKPLSKYLFVFFLLIPVVYIFISKTIKRTELMHRITIIVAIVSLCSAYIPAVVQTFVPTVYDNIADYMLDNNKRIIYSTWDHAGRVAGASNCEIIAGRWDASELFKIKSHTNVMGIYSEEDNLNAAYLLDEETMKQAKDFFGGDCLGFSEIHSFYDSIAKRELYLCFSEKQLLY